MMKYYLFGGSLAVAALGGLVVDTWSNVLAIGGGEFKINDTTTYVMAVAVLGALAGLICPLAFRNCRAAGAILAIGWMLSTGFSIGASLDRVGGARDAVRLAAMAKNDHLAQLNRDIAELRAKRDQEAERGGCGKQCRFWQEKLETAERQLNAHASRQPTDPAGQRIEALSLGVITSTTFRLLHPVAGVVALTVLINGFLLLAGVMLAIDRKPQAIVIDRTLVVVEPIVAELQAGGSASNRQLANRLGWSEAKVSRRVRRLAEQGVVRVRQDGRAKKISAA